MRRRGLTILLPLLVLAAAVALRLAASTDMDRLSLLSFDIYERNAPRPYEPMPVRIVDIDDASLAKYGQWPWPRTLIAKLVDRLTTAGAASIAFDIVFAEPDRTSPEVLLPALAKAGGDVGALAAAAADLPQHDKLFARTIEKSPVVVGQVLTDGTVTRQPKDAGYALAGDAPLAHVKNFPGVVSNLPVLEDAAKGNGFLNHEPEWDRVVRRVPLVLRLRGKPYPSLAAEAIRVAVGARSYIVKGAGANGETGFGANTGMVSMRIGPFVVPTDREGRVWLHYTDAQLPPDERYVSAKDVLDGTFDPAKIEGSIVLVGATFAASQDFQATPLSPSVPGVEIHAQVIEQILKGWFLSRPDWARGAELSFMVIVGLGLTLLLPRLGSIFGAAVTLLTLAGAAGFSWYAFREWRLLFDPVFPAVVIVVIYGIASLLGYLRTEMQQREIRTAFSRYMSPHLVDQLAKHPEMLALGGEMRTMTLMFCDIRGFTTISEGLDANQLTQFINEFLSPMTQIIMEHRGTIDKYIGDCIMAFWNAPLDDPEHARNAVLAAQEMRRCLELLNAKWQRRAEAEGRPFEPVRIGIGINTGECCVGNMGSHQRFDYSVLGDAVNLASRLEGLGKTYHVDLVIGESTAALLPDMPLIELDLVAVKGKANAVQIFTLLPAEDAVAQPALPPAIDQHRALIAAYRRQDWAAAGGIIEGGIAQALRELADFYTVYERRIEEFLTAPPPPDWDGVYVAKEK